MEKTQLLIRSNFPVKFAEIEISNEIANVRCNHRNFNFEVSFIETEPDKNYYEQAPMTIVITSSHTIRSAKITSVLDRISQGYKNPEREVASKAEDINRLEGPEYDLRFYPNEFEKFIRPIADAHWGLIAQLHLLLSWRCGSYRDFTYVNRLERLTCKVNELNWFNLPPHYQISAKMMPRPPCFNKYFEGADDITHFLNDSGVSTIPVELLYEARRLSTSGNSRSALVIAVSALEVRVKELIVVLSPKSNWLIENLPSPPTEALLRDYLPELVSDAGAFKVRIERYLDEIRKAVFLRNTITHAGKTVSPKRCVEFIDNIECVLLILESESGQKWPNELLDLKESIKAGVS